MGLCFYQVYKFRFIFEVCRFFIDVELLSDEKLLFQMLAQGAADGYKNGYKSQKSKDYQGVERPEYSASGIEYDVYKMIDQYRCASCGYQCASNNVKNAFWDVFNKGCNRCTYETEHCYYRKSEG